jgi:Mn-containing catalase
MDGPELTEDLRANAAAEAQGRLQTARLYNMTDDPGVKNMLKFNLTRDETLQQNLWLQARSASWSRRRRTRAAGRSATCASTPTSRSGQAA